MAKLYVDDMTQVILELNPNMPLSDATFLAWGGLQNTRAYDLQRYMYDKISGSGAWDKKMSEVNIREKESKPTANGTKCED